MVRCGSTRWAAQPWSHALHVPLLRRPLDPSPARAAAHAALKADRGCGPFALPCSARSDSGCDCGPRASPRGAPGGHGTDSDRPASGHQERCSTADVGGPYEGTMSQGDALPQGMTPVRVRPGVGTGVKGKPSLSRVCSMRPPPLE